MKTNFILGVDLDGVCANYFKGFKQAAATELGVDKNTLPKITQWGYSEWGLDDEAYVRLHKKAVTELRMFHSLEVIEGCVETLWRLSDAGIWIRLITHRLYTNWSHEIAVSDTVAWLDKHRIPYRDLCFLGAKPEVEADLYIDDAPHNISQLKEAGNNVIIFDQPYNHSLDGVRIKHWSEAEELVLSASTDISAVQTQLPGIDAGASRLDINKKKN